MWSSMVINATALVDRKELERERARYSSTSDFLIKYIGDKCHAWAGRSCATRDL